MNPVPKFKTALAAAGVFAVLWAPVSIAAPPPEGYADLVEKVSPSVVTITTTQKVSDDQVAGLDQMFPPGSPFEEFFKRFGTPQGPQGPKGRAEPMRALGSGFVVDPSGYIVTNFHVVDGADSIKVKLGKDGEYDAKVIGSDKETDLALLKIDAKNALPAASLGDSDKLRVGDTVLAVGNPFGLGGTVTAGIVSALGREYDMMGHAIGMSRSNYVDFIQTDAAINKGNSGGPLFNIRGEVVGVNSAIYSPNGGSVGVGFAIPSNIVKSVVAQLRDTGAVKRGWLGVMIQNVTPDIAEATGLKEPKGALIADVSDGGPSEGKLKTGDIILSFNGKAVDSSESLPRIVADTPQDKVVPVEIMRDGKRQTVSITVGKRTDDQVASLNPDDPSKPAQGELVDKLGAHVAALTAGLRQQFGIDEGVDGVLVTDVTSKTQALENGIRQGDIIQKVGSQPVKSPKELMAALDKVTTKSALLFIMRDGQQLFLGVPIA
jgi:serine protease Do